MTVCTWCQLTFIAAADTERVCEQCVSEEMHRQNDPHHDWGDGLDRYLDDGDRPGDEEWDRYVDDDPTGRCEWCDDAVYDGSDLCDRCSWMAEQAGPPAEPPRRRADGRIEG